jgi:hypothetical protein
MVNEAYATEPAKPGGVLGSILSPLTGLFNPPEYGYNTVRGLLMSYENGPPFANYADAFTDYERIVGGTIVRGPETVSADKLAGLFDAYAKGMQRTPSPYEVKDFARLTKLNPTWAENRIRMIATGAVEDTRPSPGSVDLARAAWDGAISPTDPTKSIGDVIGGWLSGDQSVTTEEAAKNLQAYQDIKALTEKDKDKLLEAIPSLAPMEPNAGPIGKNASVAGSVNSPTSVAGSKFGQTFGTRTTNEVFGGGNPSIGGPSIGTPSTGTSFAGSNFAKEATSRASTEFGNLKSDDKKSGSKNNGGDGGSRGSVGNRGSYGDAGRGGNIGSGLGKDHDSRGPR